jgi:hypothetical protein
MSIQPDMAERHARVLARLTELGLTLAERTFEDAEAAETPAERIEAVKTFHVISRSVRQSLALEARLARQQALDAREAERIAAAMPPRKPGGAELSRRIHAVRDAVNRVIWHEAEDDDTATWLEERLEARLDKAHDDDSFCAETLDDHIARLCLEMGLPEDAAQNWRDLPDPPEPDEPEDGPEDGPDEVEAAAPPDPRGPGPLPQSSA